ncbi:hypothetical protein P9B03_02140 [Metasolibacillus meyeri]|uniref:Type II secretion system protein GspF domain-containing protein n=1 Tax=Metasolibacillus meyeri TaxID=1071052 RepID=A0AAW9NR93_9BACL|nr:hypothetical protein [Metasolibacillus meyeri]MEC1177271.1 hypothetical protein [Metasolibacillus meyeri]
MIRELLTEQLREVHLSFFHLPKKRFMTQRWLYSFLLSLLFCMGISITQAEVIWYLGLPTAFFIGWKTPYLRLLMEKNTVDVKNAFLFLPFSQSFMVLLPSVNGNVYQALKLTVPYTAAPLDKKLKELIEKIEKGNNRQDYLDFAKYIGSPEAYMIMNMIYQFSEQGIQKESIQTLQRYIQNIQENKVDQLIETKMDTSFKISFLPVLLSLFIVGAFIVLIFAHYFKTIADALDVLI